MSSSTRVRTGQRWSSDGTTRTRASAAGSRASTSTLNKCTLRSPFARRLLTPRVQSFEQLNPRAVAVVVDPIQSVKGKVVIDAFRSIPPQSVMMGLEPRQSTSNVGHLGQPSIQALIHGLNRHYYSIAIAYRKTDLEQSMLLNLHKKNWTEGLRLQDWESMKVSNEASIKVSLSTFFLCSVARPKCRALGHKLTPAVRSNSECSTSHRPTPPRSRRRRPSPRNS